MIIVPLRKMTKGQKGTIHRVTASGELGRRIRDMGLVPGTPFRVQGRAPLKDPVAIRIRNFTLTLRNNESDFIEAEVEQPDESREGKSDCSCRKPELRENDSF